MSIRRYPFPYVPNSLLAFVDGVMQPVTDIDPADPDGGTYELPEDPDDAEVRAYARISPDAVPAPPTPEGEEDEEAIEEAEDEAWETDADLTDADDDEAVEEDPDAPELGS